MPITNSLKVQVDLPIFEWCRFAPAVSTSISSTTAANNSTYSYLHGRYIYYLISAASFWRYDTWTDTYEQLSSPPIAPSTWTGLQYSQHRGFEGRVLGATSTSLTIPAYVSNLLAGFDVLILSGTGAGQKRVISQVAEPVIADNGVVTAVSNTQGTISLTDTTKAWTVNQWVGYQVRITFGSGVSQVRRVLYNSATVLTLGDFNKSADDIFSNPAIFSPAISATAGSQSSYAIESSVATIDTAWTVTPDTTSRFRILSGGIFLMSYAAATPFYTMQFYDVLADTWYVRTSSTGVFAVAGTEASVDLAGEEAVIWERGIASSGTTTSLTDTTKQFSANQYVGYWMFLFSGTGVGQLRQITSNTSNQLTWNTAGTAPNATTKYELIGYTAGTLTTGGTQTLTDSTQTWTTNQYANHVVKILSGTGAGQGCQIASNTATALTLTQPLITATDSTSIYVILPDNDKVYCHQSGNAPFVLHNVEDDLGTLGRLYESGTTRIGAVNLQGQAGAGASFKPQAIASITFSGTTATVTTVNNHNFYVGRVITITGVTSSDAATYNGNFTIVSVPSTTTFTYTMGATPAANASFATPSTTVLVDATQNWTTNQWAGYLVNFNTGAVVAATGAATMATAVIASNTATTLTLSYAAASAPVNGISRFIITPNKALGMSPSTNAVSTGDNGVATSGSTTTIVNTSAAWVVNIYAGRRVKFTGGSGQGQEATITSNTSNTLTFGAVTTAAAAGTTYSIVQQNVRGVGSSFVIAFGATTPGNPAYLANNPAAAQPPNGRYIFIARGGGVVGFDRLDVTTDNLIMIPQSPQIETLGQGSMYAYDGVNRLYFTKLDTTYSQQRLYYLDLTTYIVHGAGMTPWTIPTAIYGNRMEIFQTYDNLNYLWLQRGAFQESFRQLLYY